LLTTANNSCFLAGERKLGPPVACERELQSFPHAIPESVVPELGFTWDNLYPSCSLCNTKYKGTRWSWHVVRPDKDPVLAWLDCDPETGELRCAPEFEINGSVRRRVKRTIRLFGLNADERCRARKRMIAELNRVDVEHRWEHFADYLKCGPYRLVFYRWFEMTSSGLFA
jgi:hypothetical protein